MSSYAALRHIQGKSKKNQMQRRAEELRRIEERERKFMEGAAQDIVALRRMLEHMAVALEAHDLTIAALRSLLVDSTTVTEADVDARRNRIADIKRRQLEENQRVADHWNSQIQRMRNDGLAPLEIEEIIRESRETKTEPDLIRMKRAAAGSAVSDGALPAEAFIFGGN